MWRSEHKWRSGHNTCLVPHEHIVPYYIEITISLSSVRGAQGMLRPLASLLCQLCMSLLYTNNRFLNAATPPPSNSHPLQWFLSPERDLAITSRQLVVEVMLAFSHVSIFSGIILSKSPRSTGNNEDETGSEGPGWQAKYRLQNWSASGCDYPSPSRWGVLSPIHKGIILMKWKWGDTRRDHDL